MSKPNVASTTPAANATGFSIKGSIRARFDIDIDEDTLSRTSFFVVNTANLSRPYGSVSYDPVTRIASFTPASDLEPNTTYAAFLSAAIRSDDAHGNEAMDIYTWRFTTGEIAEVEDTDTIEDYLDVDTERYETDKEALHIIGISPEMYKSNIPVSGAESVSRITIEFNRALDPDTLDVSKILLKGDPVDGDQGKPNHGYLDSWSCAITNERFLVITLNE